MTEIARMRFKSVQSPEETGALVLYDDGTFQIQPSDALRDKMAELEEQALSRSQAWGVRLGVVLIVLGTLGVGVGWLVGRIFGKLGSSLSWPRPVENVRLTRDENGIVRVTLRGLENRLQTIQMSWNPDEVLQPEAEAFLEKFAEMRGEQKDTAENPNA